MSDTETSAPTEPLRVPTWREHYLDAVLEPGQTHQPRVGEPAPLRRHSQEWIPELRREVAATALMSADPASPQAIPQPSVLDGLRPLTEDAPGRLARVFAHTSQRLQRLANRLDPDRP